MISIDLARRLADAGLLWEPEVGDRFMIPNRDLDDEVFSVSDMTIQVDSIKGVRQIFFNGAVEWALDSIEQGHVVWLPSEAQLRSALGRRFESLERLDTGFRCIAGGVSFEATSAPDAYGVALVHHLELGGDRES
ncbi:MAG: pilus assembly protein CpaE [Acidimicrobiia bacterium]|nr:pilus assembly protein CpaE [Acidimicrobiia bacterium]